MNLISATLLNARCSNIITNLKLYIRCYGIQTSTMRNATKYLSSLPDFAQ